MALKRETLKSVVLDSQTQVFILLGNKPFLLFRKKTTSGLFLKLLSRLTKSQSSFKPSIPLPLTNDFTNFFTNKIVIIREKNIHNQITDYYYGLSVLLKLYNWSPWVNFNNCFQTINMSIRPSLLQFLPLIRVSILNVIYMSRLMGYPPQAFMLAVTKPLNLKIRHLTQPA